MSATVAPVVPAPQFTVPTSTVTTPDLFRERNPAFADVLTYPTAQVQMFIDLGTAMLNPKRWRQMYGRGVELFTAHMLALQQYAIRGVPGIPGAGIGVIQSKGVSKVNVSFNTTLSAVDGAGPFNLTIFGQELLWWANLLGAGGTEVLGIGYEESLQGIVWTWARGAMIGWYNGGAGL